MVSIFLWGPRGRLWAESMEFWLVPLLKNVEGAKFAMNKQFAKRFPIIFYEAACNYVNFITTFPIIFKGKVLIVV